LSSGQVITCESACTVTVQHEFTSPLQSLTVEEGGAIAGAVLAVWAVGWGVRVLVQMVRFTDGNSSTKEE
jgi:hypothetical protein